MPSGWLIGGLCLASGLFCEVVTAKGFAEEEKLWYKYGMAAIGFIVTGGMIFTFIL